MTYNIPVPKDDPTYHTWAARESLACYGAALYPNFMIPPHIQIIVKVLEAVERGEIKRLMIFAPVRHGKSVVTSQLFPAWYQGRHPDHMVIMACHTQNLAAKFGRTIRNYINDDIHQIVFPEHRLSGDSAAVDQWATTKKGEFYAVGVGGGISGRGAHLLVIDDPIKNYEDAESQTIREKLHEWYQWDIERRLEPDGAVVIINTRWHSDDLSGWLLNEEEQEEIDDWHLLDLPAIAERDEGWRKPGDPLWPERFPIEILEKIKRKVGSRVWTSLYQQQPTAVQGTYFKRDWWKRYNWNPAQAATKEHLRYFTQPYQIIQSWDTALEDDEEHDYSVCTTWLSCASGDFLLDVWRHKVIAPDLVQNAKELAIYWRADLILVEKKASGHGLIQQLRIQLPRFPVLGIVPKMSKQQRAKMVSPYCEAGKVSLPFQAPWLKTYEDELAAFPLGANDDQVDSTSQYLNYVTQKRDQDLHDEFDENPGVEVSPYEI